MALIDFKVLPGIDKQDTESGAENRWVDCDNTRFRYGLPEKVGGWSSLVSDTIVSVARRQFAFVDLDGNKYVAIGTDKFLLIYFEGQLYDITPIKSTISSITMSAQDATQEVSLTADVVEHKASCDEPSLRDYIPTMASLAHTEGSYSDSNCESLFLFTPPI